MSINGGKARKRPPRAPLRMLKRSVKRSLRMVIGERVLWRVAQVSASAAGFDLKPQLAVPTSFEDDARAIIARHEAQTIEVVTALRGKYAAPVLGRVPVWSLIAVFARPDGGFTILY